MVRIHVPQLGMYFVYILECVDGSLYTGITTDINRRLEEHLAGEGGRYTRAKGASRIAYTEEHPNRSSASRREMEVKKLKRSEKLALIQGLS